MRFGEMVMWFLGFGFGMSIMLAWCGFTWKHRLDQLEDFYSRPLTGWPNRRRMIVVRRVTRCGPCGRGL